MSHSKGNVLVDLLVMTSGSSCAGSACLQRLTLAAKFTAQQLQRQDNEQGCATMGSVHIHCQNPSQLALHAPASSTLRRRIAANRCSRRCCLASTARNCACNVSSKVPAANRPFLSSTRSDCDRGLPCPRWEIYGRMANLLAKS
jgi:hypothetical protein